MDEQHAIQLCVKHRDPVGFEFLVEKYRREAFSHAFALLGNQEDALDACQDSFAKAFAAIPSLRELPQFYPWFYCILRNRCLNLLARRKTSDRYRETQQADAAPAMDPAGPGNLLEQREEQQRVHRALESLKPEHREILVMKYVQECRYEEIAGVLGIPRGTVMSRLYYARMALRDEYLKLDRDTDRSAPEKAT
jgi:RNA polymerase sigma-70 factor (ECF subfamily)